MKKLICGLLGLFVAASVEASSKGDLHAALAADFHPSFCSEVKSVEKQSVIALGPSFSLPEIAKCHQHHYSLFGNEFECTKLQSGSEIFFPSDGRQPTAAEAVQWSCANAEDELVTDWYVSMFGLSDWEKTSLNMGFNTKNELCKIINFDPELDRDPTKSAESQAFKATFIANFRKIASVSVGRVLLYRLLLEIRRTDLTGNGCIDATLEKSLSEDDLQKRNNLRNIIIKNADKNSFGSGGYIKFHDSKDTKETNAISSERMERVPIIRYARTDDVGLFHEMLHWFHALREIKRFRIEKNIDSKTNDEDIFKSTMHMEDEKIILWYGEKNKSDDELAVKMEEFRTIMGYTVKVTKNSEEIYVPDEAQNGDDLCENLYRICVGQKLRYGHVSADDPEITVSKSALDKAKEFYNKAIKEGNYRVNKA